MGFSSLGSIMYCRTCEEYTVINVDEKNPKLQMLSMPFRTSTSFR